MHFLADDHGVGAVTIAATHSFGQARAEQPGRAGFAVKVARQIADTLPLVDVRKHFTFSEGAHGLSQLFAFGGVPDAHSCRLFAQGLMAGTFPGCRYDGCAATRPAPWLVDRTAPDTRRPAREFRR